ncbi:hypothetical protein SAMN05421812_111166 [Asanoa hainanensis]|uniref:Recombinase zinc beta ribbon domain-containing protein n=1 Tax=Asanoa hainanensis TaxID=560556 RepID=A0A239NZ10_9ACTN|nr:zinc ribbon domain-containing protein [Asanoa hainanensis]SNT59359.1 hypothetical protein SAMN05421812_111166 [Asanoa hainanensis]
MGTENAQEPAVARGLCNGLVHCGTCGADMTAETIRGLRRYICRCSRAVPADELDVLVLGRLYDRRRSSGQVDPVRLCDEAHLVDTYLRGVTVGADWTRPAIRWAEPAATSTAAEGRSRASG